MGNQNHAGVLYLVATPIGNLGDITYRAVDILKSVDIIAAEDTRHSRILLSHYQITARKLVSYHSHNLDSATPRLVKQMLEGASVALISDAGSPGISDPGAVITKEAVCSGVKVLPIPGATAPTLAVTASGFPCARFIFDGFPPRKKGRKTIMESWKDEKRTIIFFESSLRIVKTLNEIKDRIGSREVCIARELTKKFEEFIRGDIDDVIAELTNRSSIKGEITVVIAPCGWVSERS